MRSRGQKKGELLWGQQQQDRALSGRFQKEGPTPKFWVLEDYPRWLEKKWGEDHSTVSEPASEPRAAGPIREAEDTEGKRRRILSPLREENRNRGNQTASTREERTIQTGHEPSRGVRDRVEDIETRRIRDERVGTRRSRSPLPFTIRQAQNREDREAEERGDAPGARILWGHHRSEDKVQGEL